MSISEFLTLEEWLEVDETTGAIQHAGAWTTQAQTVEDIRGGIMEPSEVRSSRLFAMTHKLTQSSHLSHPSWEPPATHMTNVVMSLTHSSSRFHLCSTGHALGKRWTPRRRNGVCRMLQCCKARLRCIEKSVYELCRLLS